MAKNPMQRKAQNSFLLGMFITLLITGVIIALLIVQLTKITKEQQEEQAKLKDIYVLNQDVNSGDTITSDKLKIMTVDSTTVPANAISSTAELDQVSNVLDSNGNLIKKFNVISKINLKMGTILTSDMISQEGEISADLRKVEYNMIVLPSQLQTNKYIDVRLTLPNGKDYLVVSHKKIEIPNAEGIDSINTIWMNLTETEILTLSCAIVESYKMPGSKLYAAEYIEPGLQDAATATYIPDDSTINLISKDPNCVTEAKNELFKRNNDAAQKSAVRNPINNSLNENAEDAQDNVEENVEEEIQKTQEERQRYLDSLGATEVY